MKSVFKHVLRNRLAVALVSSFAFAGAASAATVGFDPAIPSVAQGDSVDVEFVFSSEAGDPVTAFSGAISFDNTEFTAVAEDPPGPNLCGANNNFGPTEGRVAIVASGLSPGTTAICTITFTAAADVPLGDYNFTYVNPVFGGTDGDDTTSPVGITVENLPPDVVLAFSPDSAVVFPGGTSGDTTAESIDVTVGSGTIGTGTVDNCVITGANAAAFAVVGGDPTTVPPPGSIDLEVTLANSALSATLTCDVADAGADATHVWALSAPAGDPVPAPEYSSSPVAGSPLTCDGQPGSVTQTSITITNTGFAGVGSDLDYTCVASGAGFSILSGAADTLAVGEDATVTVQCTVPAEDAPAAEGDLDCTSNDAANSPANYPLSSIAATAPPPVPQPNVVPASSLWSQLSLIGLLAALGLLVVGIRRNH